ncbi:MAG: prolyl oligopeptidase family serine peptidase [Planctomycetes bacterium]|nr:prolyl oligopeptidase family serine peptidase [Planctomycetota bacterium]
MVRRLVLFASLVALVSDADSNAQNLREEYEATTRLEAGTRDTVDRAGLRPRFIEGSDRFWYRVRTGANAGRYVVVDPERGTRELAFDHAALAAAFGARVRTALDAENLWLGRLEFSADLRVARFSVGGKRWEYDRESQRLTELAMDRAGSGFDPRRAPHSVHGGDAVTLEFENRRADAITLSWIDDGGRRHAYGTIASGATRVQPTYVGHAWVAADAHGDEFAAFVATADVDRWSIPTAPIREPDAPTPPHPTDAGDASRSAPVRVVAGAITWTDVGGAAHRIEAGDARTFDAELTWSPTRTRFVASRIPVFEERTIPLIESSPSDQVQPKWRLLEYAKPGDPLRVGVPALFVVEATGPREIPIEPAALFASPWSIDAVRWSRDGARFTVEVVERGHSAQRLLAIDGATGKATTLVENVSDTFVDTTQKSFLHWIDDGDDALLWMSERSGWNGLEHVEARAGGPRRAISPTGVVVKRVAHVDDATRRVWFIACGLTPGEDPYHEDLCVVGHDGSGFRALTDGDATHAITFTPSHRFFVDVASRVDLPPVTVLRSANDGAIVVELERADWSRLLATGWRAPERFVAKGRDGVTDIWGILIRPTHFDPTRRYPVVEQIYAGPHDAHVPKAFEVHSRAREIAELGFVVAQIDGMGTNWRPKAFHDVCWRNLKDAGLPDRIAWLRAAATTRPELDLTRVGIYGGSAGGQNALAALLHHGDFYSVAVADCGCHDNRMDKVWWNEAWMGYPIGPWYADNSNVTHAAKLEGALLLVVGELDTNVDPASTMQVVNALVAADRDFDLLVLPGAGHGAAETPYGARRRAEFLVRHLRDSAPRR